MKKILFLLCVSLLYKTAVAQQTDLHASIPFDPEVRTGVLPNGMTYYVRRNIKPEHRAELRLVLNAGSILETDQQQGLAHLCEHMAFNGTTNFEKSELVDFLERTGVRFGADLNAYTSFDETVYMLQIPTDTEKVFLKGIQILQDWVQNVTYDSTEIDKERGVVVEEWRLGQGASDRMLRKNFPVLFHDSRYADRITIGKKEIIEQSPYDTLRRFYREWYRPDLMAVIAVGDFDPEVVVSLIKEKFSSLLNPPREKTRVLYPVPDHNNLLVGIATDKEATYSSIDIEYKFPVEEAKTVKDYRTMLIEQLFITMLDRRYSELIQQPDPPFTFASSNYSSLVRTKAAYSNFAVVKDNGIERGLQTLLEENERVQQFGFTQTEFDRARKEIVRRTEKSYNERDKTESRNFAREYVSYFLEHEPSPGIAWEYKMQQELLPAISLAEVNALASKWITSGKNCVILVNAPEKAGVIIPSEDQIRKIFNDAQQMQVSAYVDQVSTAPLMEKQPMPSKVINEDRISAYNITQWTLANGVKVILKPTDFKNDEILFSSYKWGGTSRYGDKDFMSAVYATGLVANSGIGNYNEAQLEKYLSDKVVSVAPGISELQQTMSGSASPKDLETMLQLIYLYFTAPRKDSDAFKSAMQQDLAFVQNQHASPEATFRDTLQLVMNQHNFRFQPLDEQRLKLVEMNRAYEIYKERFADAGNWTFVFVGNFIPEDLKSKIEMYLGGLPSLNKKETFRDLGIGPPAGIINKEVYKGSEPKSAVSLIFTGLFEYNRHNRNDIFALQKLLNIRLRETLREDMGGVYGFGVSPSLKHFPCSRYQLSISFGCSPGNVDKLVAAALQVLDSVKQNGCSTDNLLKVKESLLKEREVNLKQNNFWLSALLQSDMNGENILELEDFNKQVESLTSEDFKRLANAYFNTKNYATFVLYPEK